MFELFIAREIPYPHFEEFNSDATGICDILHKNGYSAPAWFIDWAEDPESVYFPIYSAEGKIVAIIIPKMYC